MNPFFEVYNTPFQVPPFDKIETWHYLPAFEEGIRQHLAEVETILANSEKPSFANTVEALEYSGLLLDKVSQVFFNLREAHTNDELDKIAGTAAPLLSRHHDSVSFNETLFERVQSVYTNRENIGLDPGQRRLLDETYKRFVRNGAKLPPEKKEELKSINEKLAVLQLKFSQNLLAETNHFQLVIEAQEDLAGLPESVTTAAREAAGASGMEGKWIFTLHKPSWIPFLTYSENRGLREKLYKAMYNRSNNGNGFDNKGIISQIINLRIAKANLLGYRNWASFILEDNMAKTPDNVYELLYQVWEPGLRRARSEVREMQDIIDREGGGFKLASWDWWYYAEKVRGAKYDLDENQLRPYFELGSVRNGMFDVAKRLYGVKFIPLAGMPLYHPDCEVFEVTDAKDTHTGILYMDYHPRLSKSGGAWMTNYREQYLTREGENIRPVVSITCNFSKASGGKPALLSFDEVETLYHEFGHALHGLFSQCRYKSLSGTNVPRDFVELPSQIMEHWASEPEVLRMYARHNESGVTIPEGLIRKMERAGKFNQGFATTEFIAAAVLDMDYHTLTRQQDIVTEEFERLSMRKLGLIDEIIPRYKSTYFSHIFPSGYSSAYYSYLWAEVLDADAFEAFKETGDIFSPEVAWLFRTHILEKGNTLDPMELYIQFRGKQPGLEPLLKNRGLL